MTALENDTRCPVCNFEIEPPVQRDYGDKKRFSCPRCGTYEASRSVLAMLPSRLGNDPVSRARVSHGIRKAIRQNSEFMLSRDKLSEFINNKLPGIDQQKKILVQYIEEILGEDELGTTPIPWPEELVGILGVINDKRAERLIEIAVQDGLVFRAGGSDSFLFGLTEKGWTTARSLKNQNAQDGPEVSSLSINVPEVESPQEGFDRMVLSGGPIGSSPISRAPISGSSQKNQSDDKKITINKDGDLLGVRIVPKEDSLLHSKAIENLLNELDGCVPKDVPVVVGSNLQQIPLSSESFDTIRQLTQAALQISKSPRLPGSVKQFLEHTRDLLVSLKGTLDAVTGALESLVRLKLSVKGAISAINWLIGLF